MFTLLLSLRSAVFFINSLLLSFDFAVLVPAFLVDVLSFSLVDFDLFIVDGSLNVT
jgi:hypothetical protein